MDVHVASALAQSLHLLSLHEHRLKELLLPLDPVLEPELLDDAPMAELDDPPVPELDDAPVPVLDDAPVPELDDAPVPVLDDAPVPELDDAPVPVLDDAPVLEPDAELLLPAPIVPAELLAPVLPPALLLPPPWVTPVDVFPPFPVDDCPPDWTALLLDPTPVMAPVCCLGESPESAAHA